MRIQTRLRIAPRTKKRIRTIGGALLVIFVLAGASTVLILKTKELVFESILRYEQNATEMTPTPFPVSVYPKEKRIIEQATIDLQLDRYIAAAQANESAQTWWQRAAGALVTWDWYQNLASPTSRILVIRSGDRHEEVVSSFGDILRWNESERTQFKELVASTPPTLSEGKFFPEHYVVHKDAKPDEVAHMVIDRFRERILIRYDENVEAHVPLRDALVIASLLEREAYDFADMRNVAGVIWNRLFVDMRLQLDASLQYVKGSRPHEPWWPRVHPDDKFLDSPFNTYQHKGLPPTPIGNPSVEAVVAALNPTATNCMFYFHDASGAFHCAVTYEEHVKLLKQHYGRGK